jgi:hypothetical protein
MNSKESDRRRFLKKSTALAGGLALGAIPGRSQVEQGEVPVKQVGLGEVPVKEDWEGYGVRSRFDKSRNTKARYGLRCRIRWESSRLPGSTSRLATPVSPSRT